jgi:hypothetical protein
MPSPYSGTTVSAVAPAAPRPPEAAVANQAGEQGKTQANPEKAGPAALDSNKLKPHNAEDAKDDPKKDAWIEIEMVGEDGKPVAGEKYRVILPDGTTVDEGTLDEKGYVKISGFEPGSCKISFPNLDAKAWDKA